MWFGFHRGWGFWREAKSLDCRNDSQTSAWRSCRWRSLSLIINPTLIETSWCLEKSTSKAQMSQLQTDWIKKIPGIAEKIDQSLKLSLPKKRCLNPPKNFWLDYEKIFPRSRWPRSCWSSKFQKKLRHPGCCQEFLIEDLIKKVIKHQGD